MSDKKPEERFFLRTETSAVYLSKLHGKRLIQFLLQVSPDCLPEWPKVQRQ